MARPTLTPDQVEDFRRRATEVSMRLFVDQGYEGFSLRALARELGCSHATPYRYFDGKAEIFAHVRAEGFRRFGAFLEERLEEVEAPLDRVRALAQGYFDFAATYPSAFRAAFELDQAADDAYPFVEEAAGEAWGVLRRVIREAVEAGTLEGEVGELAHTMWAGIHGVATLHLANKLTVGRPTEAVLSSMTEALIRAHSS